MDQKWWAMAVMSGSTSPTSWRTGSLLVAAGELGDVAVERGREQQGLAVRQGAVEQALDGGEEPHVGHAVGLVDDDDAHLGEADAAAADEVLEAAGAGDEHVDPAADRLGLGAVADTAVHGGDGAVSRLGEGRQLVLDLVGQLTGRGQDQGGGVAGTPPSRVLTSVGMPKAMVLPEPVGARPQRSRPARASGMVAACTSKALVMPRSSSAATMRAGTPRSAKDGAVDSFCKGVSLDQGCWMAHSTVWCRTAVRSRSVGPLWPSRVSMLSREQVVRGASSTRRGAETIPDGAAEPTIGVNGGER